MQRDDDDTHLWPLLPWKMIDNNDCLQHAEAWWQQQCPSAGCSMWAMVWWQQQQQQLPAACWGAMMTTTPVLLACLATTTSPPSPSHTDHAGRHVDECHDHHLQRSQRQCVYMASSCTTVDIILCYYTSNIDILFGCTHAGSTDSTLCCTHRVFETPIEPLLRHQTRHWTIFAGHLKTQLLSQIVPNRSIFQTILWQVKNGEEQQTSVQGPVVISICLVCICYDLLGENSQWDDVVPLKKPSLQYISNIL